MQLGIAAGNRGCGKSWSVTPLLVAPAALEPIRVLCARETQKSIAESVHRLLKDQVVELQLGATFEVQESRILGRNGSEFGFAGIRQQGVANLKSFEGVDICRVEEALVTTKRSWDVLIPTIRKPVSEIWITFNPELDTDETYVRFVADPPEGALVIACNWNDNPSFSVELDKQTRDWLRPIRRDTARCGKGNAGQSWRARITRGRLRRCRPTAGWARRRTPRC